MSIQDFETKLQAYADVIVQVGLNLQPGQRLMINALLESAPLVRKVTAAAYRQGCRFVEVLWRDEQVDLLRFENAPRDSFEEAPLASPPAMLKHVENGGAFLSITSQNPGLLKDQDPTLTALVEKTRAQLMKPISDLLRRNAFNWCIAGYPSDGWAEKVFPSDTPEMRIERLWEALFMVTRADLPDPVAAWKQHVAELATRKHALTAKHYHALHLTAPGTDLTIGLADDHRWMGGAVDATLGMAFIPNLPTEEVFTLPHRERINGVVTASKPLSHGGKLIENFCLTFKDGLVTEIQAADGEEALRKLIATDAGAASLGEIALVPHRSPVSDSGILFYNTLLDENAACHIALGNGLNFCLQDGESMSQEDYVARGGNASLIHVDFMIGSDKMDIDGLTADGRSEPVMRGGAWAF